MNFELADTLTSLLTANKLDDAIGLAEQELKQIPETDFHKIIGKNLNHLKANLKQYLGEYDKATSAVLRKEQGFLRSLFSPKEPVKPAAYYCEMNGFTINYNRWHIDLFSYKMYKPNDWDWLSDFYDSTEKSFTITGFEEIQKAFQDFHENNKLGESTIEQAYEVCELLVILRLQELFRETYKEAEKEWSKIPMFVTAHDYEMIYNVK